MATIACEACGSSNQSGKFCTDCGAPLDARCPQCDAKLQPQGKFCGNCGTSLSNKAADGERRQLSVLFSDLVGSMDLSRELDPEELRDVVNEYQNICSRVIADQDGHVAQFLGDGVLAYFGYPRAYEDDACRAVRAGLAIVEELKKHPQGKIKPSVRVGIHTGVVVIGETGGDSHREILAMGEAPNLAARVQAEAKPGQVLITHDTRRHVLGFFELETLPKRHVKGHEESISLYRAVRDSGAESRITAGASSGLTPFVGRETETALLRNKWNESRNGVISIIEIQGEAGIGKSRMVRMLKVNFVGDQGAFVECRCSPHHQGSALYPLIGVLEIAFRFIKGDTDPQKISKIELSLKKLGLSAVDALPLLATFLNVAGAAPIKEPNPQKQRQMLFGLLSQMLTATIEQQPTVLCIEDLHWADPSTLDFLEELMVNLRRHRVLLCLTYRPEFEPTWGANENRTVLELNRLNRSQSEAVIMGVAGNRALPPKVIDGVIERAEGVPLYLEEMAKSVLESGMLVERGESFELPDSVSSDFLPPTLAESLAARLDRLEEAKPVAQLASVIGRQFSYELLAAVSPWPEVGLRGALAQLKDAELVYQRGEPPNAIYIFKHALIRDAAYNLLLRKLRDTYHQKIADTILEKMPVTAEGQPEIVAHHFNSAGKKREAIEYWQKAGARALGRAENREAVRHFNEAIKALETLPETPERLQMELGLQLSLMGAAMAIWGWASEEVEKPCLRANELSLALGDEQQYLASLYGLWTVQFLRGRVLPAMQIANELAERTKNSPIKLFKVLAEHANLLPPLYNGKPKQCLAHCEAALALLDDDTDTEWMLINSFQLSTSVVALSFASAAQWLLGREEDSRKTLERCLNLADELNHPPTTAYAKTYSLYFYHFRREPGLVHEQAREAFELADLEGFKMWRGMALVFVGFSEFEKGDKQKGVETTRRGLDEMFEVGNKVIFVQNMALYGEMLWQAGQTDEAIKILEDGMRWADENAEHFMESELYRLRGAIRTSQGKYDLAYEDFERALALCKEQEALPLELRTLVSMSKLIALDHSQADPAPSMQHLLAKYEQGKTHYDFTEAKTYLASRN